MGSVTPVNNINISDSVLWGSYLLPEIMITPLRCLIIISVHSKNTYCHLFTRVNLEAMAIKGYSAFPKPHHQII